jgi:aryl-alcohol dehydrogenase-like predicted oxidoreductase
MTIPQRVLGKTGVQVSALGLGGVCWNLLEEDADAVQVVHRAIDCGITYLDTASSYKDSERRLGLALKERDRNGLFIATKCIQRAGDEAKRELEESFARLDLEVIDLIQLHAIDQAEDLGAAFGADGVFRLIEEYRAAGKIRFVGLTGHTHPAVFPELINQYDFDTVLNPMGAINRVWNDFSATTLPAARSKDMGVIGMKVMAYGQFEAQDRPRCLHYTLAQDVDVAVVGMDSVEQVEENVAAAQAFAPLTAAEEEALLERALELVPRAKKELFWLPEQRLAS